MDEKTLFSSPELQKVHQESKAVFECNLQKVKNISNDIVALENELKGSAIPFEVIYVASVDKASRFSDQGFELIDTYTVKCVFWGKNEQDKYRLSFSQYYFEPEDYETYQFWGKPELKLSKPLDETKTQLRLRLGAELHHFYRAIMDALQSNESSEQIIIPSPNLQDKIFEEFIKKWQNNGVYRYHKPFRPFVIQKIL